MMIEDRPAFQAGEWKVEPELNSLSRAGVERHIEPKAMQVLLTLASREAHVFSKEELLSAVWPGTFVSDDVLTRCISILRRVTEDDPHDPRFIRTIPKVGYRLVAPVVPLPQEPEVSPPPPAVQVPTDQTTQTTDDDAGPVALAARAELNRRWLLALPAAIIVLAAIVGWFGYVRRVHPLQTVVPPAYRITQFTSYVGEQTQPAFSPDGTRVAFVKIAEGGVSRRIFVKQIGSQTVAELTRDHDEQFSPVWSPDGREIAYLSRSEAGLGINIADVNAEKAARKVSTPQEPSDWEDGALSWSPDGKSLIFPDHTGDEADSRIFRLDLATRHTEAITSPPAGWEGDLNPAYSPDGQNIAFTRASETAIRDIYWISLADGRLHRLTSDRMNIGSLAWSADSAAVVFSSNRGGKFALWQAALAGGPPERLAFGAEDAFQPSVGPLPGQFAYTQGSSIWSIVRVQNALPHETLSAAQAVLSSTQHDSAPSLSPDGRSFAMQSLRSGTQEIWVASTSGSDLRQLTFMNSMSGSPSWSNHSDAILFDSRPDGHSHIFVVPVAGGQPRQVTFGDSNDIVPRWSRDDRTVFFRSNRGGQWRLWKVALAGENPQPVTLDDGIEPQQSADGLWLYYTRGDESGLWRTPVAGGAETQVLSQPAAGYWGYWQLTPSALYYLDLSRSPATIRRLDLKSKQVWLFATLSRTPPPFAGLTVVDGGKVALTTQESDAGRHITLVERQP